MSALVCQEATRGAHELLLQFHKAGASYGNLLAIAEALEEGGPIREALLVSFSYGLCKMGPLVKADFLRAVTEVVMRRPK